MVHRDDTVCAFAAAGQFSADPAYLGHVLVIPVEHHESFHAQPRRRPDAGLRADQASTLRPILEAVLADLPLPV